MRYAAANFDLQIVRQKGVCKGEEFGPSCGVLQGVVPHVVLQKMDVGGVARPKVRTDPTF